MSKDDVIETAFECAMGFILGGAILFMSLPLNYQMRDRPQNAIMFWVGVVIIIGVFCFYVSIFYNAYRDYKKSEAKKDEKNVRQKSVNLIKCKSK